MPFANSEDAKLPDAIKKLPKAKRQQFVSAFNSSFKGSQASDGEGGENFALAVAYAAIKDKDEKPPESAATPEAGADTSNSGKQAMLGGFDDDTLNESPPPDLKESALPPGVHISQGRAKCASCNFFFVHGEWCQLFKVSITAIQLCDDYDQISPSFYDGKAIELVGEIQETESEPVKAGARYSKVTKKILQDMHDSTTKLGAVCPDKKPYKKAPPTVTKSDAEASEKSCVPNQMAGCNNTLKVVRETPDYLIVKNHIVLFGGRDYEGVVNDNVNPDGSRGEFFTKRVALESLYTQNDVVVMDFDHGHVEGVEPSKHEPLGKVLWKTAKVTDVGVEVERQLLKQHYYFEVIQKLIELEAVGTSSEAIKGSKIKNIDGEIKAWELYRDSVTLRPMDGRMVQGKQHEQWQLLQKAHPWLKDMLTNGEQATKEPTLAEVQRNKEEKERLIIQYGISK